MYRTDYKLYNKIRFSNNDNVNCIYKNDPICKISQGGFGVIYMTNNRDENNKYLAYKYAKTNENEIRRLELPKVLKDQYKILDKLKKSKICDRFLCHYGKNNDGFFMENLNNYMDLQVCIHNYVDVQNLLTKTMKQSIGKELLESVKLLHQYNIIHGDIKPENIMVLFENNKVIDVRLIDFGGSFEKVASKDEYNLKIFTPKYSFFDSRIRRSFDFFKDHDKNSLGIILLILIGTRNCRELYKDYGLTKSQKNIFKKLNILLVEYYNFPKYTKFFDHNLLLPNMNNDRFLLSDVENFREFLQNYIPLTSNDLNFNNEKLLSPRNDQEVGSGKKCPANKPIYNSRTNRCVKERCRPGTTFNPQTKTCKKVKLGGDNSTVTEFSPVIRRNLPLVTRPQLQSIPNNSRQRRLPMQRIPVTSVVDQPISVSSRRNNRMKLNSNTAIVNVQPQNYLPQPTRLPSFLDPPVQIPISNAVPTRYPSFLSPVSVVNNSNLISSNTPPVQLPISSNNTPLSRQTISSMSLRQVNKKSKKENDSFLDYKPEEDDWLFEGI